MRGLIAAAALAFAAAAHPATARPPVPVGHPQTGLPVIPLTITGANGRSHAFRVEYADTEARQATGMMFRPHVPRGTGMIFPQNRPASFWMHNTISSLDLIFIAPDRRIESIAAKAPPLSDTPISSRGVVDSVLEIGPGEAARLGIHEGDRVEWTAPLAKPVSPR